MLNVTQSILKIPRGFSLARYQQRLYRLVRNDYAGGRSIKVEAKELGGNGYISFNYYRTSGKDHLKPCEMPIEKVLNFLNNFELLHT